LSVVRCWPAEWHGFLPMSDGLVQTHGRDQPVPGAAAGRLPMSQCKRMGGTPMPPCKSTGKMPVPRKTARRHRQSGDTADFWLLENGAAI
jgi:hypothetical protein